MTADQEIRERLRVLEVEHSYTRKDIVEILERQKASDDKQQQLLDLLNKAMGARWVIIVLLGLAGIFSWHTVTGLLGLDHLDIGRGGK